MPSLTCALEKREDVFWRSHAEENLMTVQTFASYEYEHVRVCARTTKLERQIALQADFND